MRTQRPLFSSFSLLLTLLSPPFLLLLLLLHPTTAATRSGTKAFIRSSCDTTLYPDLCFSSFSRYSRAIQDDPARLARVAIAVSHSIVLNTFTYLLHNASRRAHSGRAAVAAHDCVEVFDDAAYNIRRSLRQMRSLGSGSGSGESFAIQMDNVVSWLGAAMTDESTCTEGFELVADGDVVKAEVVKRVVKVEAATSNALDLVSSYASKVTRAP